MPSNLTQEIERQFMDEPGFDTETKSRVMGVAEHFEKKISELQQAVGLATTFAPDLEMDGENPLAMMKEIEASVLDRDALLETAWGIIANAHGGDWDAASEASGWRAAAERWRDEYHASPFGRGGSEEVEEAELCESDDGCDDGVVCRGSLMLGTACRRCERCSEAIQRDTTEAVRLLAEDSSNWDDAMTLLFPVAGLGKFEMPDGTPMSPQEMLRKLDEEAGVPAESETPAEA